MDPPHEGAEKPTTCVMMWTQQKNLGKQIVGVSHKETKQITAIVLQKLRRHLESCNKSHC